MSIWVDLSRKIPSEFTKPNQQEKKDSFHLMKVYTQLVADSVDGVLFVFCFLLQPSISSRVIWRIILR